MARRKCLKKIAFLLFLRPSKKIVDILSHEMPDAVKKSANGGKNEKTYASVFGEAL
jgi:hypothetical protein